MPNNIYSLKHLGLPQIQDLNDLSNSLRLSTAKLAYLVSRTDHLYKTYDLPKKSGGKRKIAQPNRELKAVQSWILRNILDKLSTSPHSKGFDLGTSILQNVQPHKSSNYILSIDLVDFFPSISARKVFGIFNSVGYDKNASHILTTLCTYDGWLPQGAPTSPKLANLICAKLDSRIHGYVGPKDIVYTRYADDITLSSKTLKKIEKIKHFIGTIISDEDFTVNKSKTKLCGTRAQKKITGLVLSDDSVGIGRIKMREIRSKIHHLFTNQSNQFSHVNGLLSFVYGVDYKSYKKLLSFIKKMKERYPRSEACKLIQAEIKK